MTAGKARFRADLYDPRIMDHDRLFKELLRTFFREFVELFLPEVARLIRPGAVEFLDKEVFTDINSDVRHEVDLVAKVRLRAGGQAFLLIHVENQAVSHPDFARRMFQYFARLHEKFGLPVLPVALFSFDRPLRPEPSRYQVEVEGFKVLDFSFRTIQLNRLNWRDYLRNPNPIASALMAKMKFATGDRPHVKLECLRMVATLKLSAAKSAVIGTFMTSYLKLTAEENARYNTIVESIEPKEREQLMEWTNEWYDEGHEKGLEKGLEKGRREGRLLAYGLATRLLTRQFGRLSPKLTKNLQKLDDTSFMELGDKLTGFKKLADLEAWIAKKQKRKSS